MVLIRFVTSGNQVSSIYVADNGHGIPKNGIDTAMTIGGVREYTKSDLGHFGLGLKAASFSQAASLTLISHAKGSSPVGRRWLEGKATKSFTVDVVDPAFCAHELDRRGRSAGESTRSYDGISSTTSHRAATPKPPDDTSTTPSPACSTTSG